MAILNFSDVLKKFRFGADIPVLEFLTERRGLFRDGVLKLMISRICLNFPS